MRIPLGILFSSDHPYWPNEDVHAPAHIPCSFIICLIRWFDWITSRPTRIALPSALPFPWHGPYFYVVFITRFTTFYSICESFCSGRISWPRKRSARFLSGLAAVIFPTRRVKELATQHCGRYTTKTTLILSLAEKNSRICQRRIAEQLWFIEEFRSGIYDNTMRWKIFHCLIVLPRLFENLL